MWNITGGGKAVVAGIGTITDEEIAATEMTADKEGTTAGTADTEFRTMQMASPTKRKTTGVDAPVVMTAAVYPGGGTRAEGGEATSAFAIRNEI
jgi:hypothetical protein